MDDPTMLTLLQDAGDMRFERSVVRGLAERWIREAHRCRSRDSVCTQLAFALSLHAGSDRPWERIQTEVDTYMRRWLEDEGLDDQ